MSDTPMTDESKMLTTESGDAAFLAECSRQLERELSVTKTTLDHISAMLEKTQSELAEWKTRYANETARLSSELYAKEQKLNAELAEARKDTERLDAALWGKSRLSITLGYHDVQNRRWIHERELNNRSEIDAAMGGDAK